MTFGDTAPTVTAPTGAQTTLAYTATPSTVCTVDSGTGALTLAGVGSCVVTVTAESSANYNQETATFTVTVQDTLALSVDAIATDDTVNIAEKTAGFAISGATGSEGGVSVTVTVGLHDADRDLGRDRPGDLVGERADQRRLHHRHQRGGVGGASKTGFTAPSPVTRTLAVDLAAPSVSYTAPASLKVGVAITAVTPTTADTDIASYSATGLPSGLTIHSGTGAISGTPDTAEANTATVTVTVTDSAGNPTTVSLAFPAVDKGDQTLTGFAYSPDTVTFGDTAPTVTAPSGAQTTLEYSATPSTVCTVDSGTGALTLAGVGSCVVTVTAESSANYNQARATFTVTVQDTLALSVDAIATDNTVNIAEKTAGFAISGAAGSEGGVSVTVTVGSMTLTATSAETDPATWSVSVPTNAAYITGTSVAVSASASKTGFAAPSPVTRTLAVDLAAPSVSYTAPASLKVGVTITRRDPDHHRRRHRVVQRHRAALGSDHPLRHRRHQRHPGHGRGEHRDRHGDLVTDTDGNPADVSITFPTVDKGDQTLTGFAYSPDTVTFGNTAHDGDGAERGADHPGVLGHALDGVHRRLGDGRADPRRGGRVRDYRHRRVERQLQPGEGHGHRHRAGHPGAERRRHCHRQHGQHRREDGRVRDLGHHRLGGRRGGDRDGELHDARPRPRRVNGAWSVSAAGRRCLHHRHQRGGVGEREQERIHLAGRRDAHSRGRPRRAIGDLTPRRRRSRWAWPSAP